MSPGGPGTATTMASRARPPIVTFRAGDAAAGAVRAYRRESARWPYHAARMHGHRFFVLNYFDRGAGELQLPGRTLSVGPGHVFVAAPGELHDTTGVAPMGGWVVEFTSEFLARPDGTSLLLPRSDGSWLSFAGRRVERPVFAEVPAPERASWEERLRRLVREVRESRLGSVEAIRAMLELLLVDLARLLVPDGRGAAAPRAPLLHEVFAVVDRRFAEPGVSLAAVARAVGRSPSHVTALVRRETGMTVLEWLTQRRMAEARRRLRETDEDVAIVAERVGYLDPAYFTRLFRREHGVSPRAFRRGRR